MAELIPYADIEAKWQRRWEQAGLFKAPDIPRPGRKFYCLDMFPYPSADGLHVGHPEGYTATDVLCRYRRRLGDDVLHPMGWDAFGLPAENFALQTGTHPRTVTRTNISNFRRQIRSLGFSYDWDREADTTDPGYYRWTQWIFLQLYKKGLAYEGVAPINWCPSCKTGLANEEVHAGACERCGAAAERRDMRQWLLRITAYAERLLADLDGLDWPASTLAMQRNWIGRSEGALVRFRTRAPGLPARDREIEVFTTRPDTLYGATYLVLAPEHPWALELADPLHRDEVAAYAAAARRRPDLERSDLQKDKTGVFTGSFATHPLTGENIPIWVADYVLAQYGTGAVMAVPAHDERDFGFAKQFRLPVTWVVRTEKALCAEQAYCGDGIAVRSPLIEGLPTAEAASRMIAHLESKGLGRRLVTYKLRDWVFSRQRYWGEPIPIIHCPRCGPVPVPERDLPVLLPDVQDYRPTGTGESPLAGIESWTRANCPSCGASGRRETNTMPQWAGSCWYYLRFMDPHNAQRPWGRERESAWGPVDCYVGGAEHAVLHLLYARFWHKALYDLGCVSTKEPFRKLRHQGMVLSYAYRDSRGGYHGYEELDIAEGGRAVLKDTGESIEPQVEKMSKSKKNVINPDEVLRRFGADCFRMYEMFMGPFEDAKPWDTRGIEGIARFLRRVWALYANPSPWADGEGLLRLRHRTIAKIGSDIANFQCNTAVSALMIYLNEIQRSRGPSASQQIPETGRFPANPGGGISSPDGSGTPPRPMARADAEAFLSLLNPFAPHLSEELWERSGHDGFLSAQPWPVHEERFLRDAQVELAVQVNGKLRDRLLLEASSPEERVREAALALPKIRGASQGRSVVKVIVVPDKLVNIVLS